MFVIQARWGRIPSFASTAELDLTGEPDATETVALAALPEKTTKARGFETDAGEIGSRVRVLRGQLTRFLRPENIVKGRRYKCLLESEAAKTLECLVGKDDTCETVPEVLRENPEEFRTVPSSEPNFSLS